MSSRLSGVGDPEFKVDEFERAGAPSEGIDSHRGRSTSAVK